jgi:hypothetical protein
MQNFNFVTIFTISFAALAIAAPIVHIERQITASGGMYSLSHATGKCQDY